MNNRIYILHVVMHREIATRFITAVASIPSRAIKLIRGSSEELLRCHPRESIGTVNNKGNEHTAHTRSPLRPGLK